jgi:hypothetical protein
VVLLIYLEISVDPTMIPLMARQGQIAIVWFYLDFSGPHYDWPNGTPRPNCYRVILLRDFSGPNYDWPNGTPRPNCYRVILLRDFSGPNHDWPNGTPRPNCYCYNKIEAKLMYMTVFFLRPHSAQRLCNILIPDFVLPRVPNVSVSSSPTVNPDSYHVSLVLDCKLN